MSSSVHADNKKKDILILVEGPIQGLHDTTLTAEKKYSINFTESSKKYCLSLHYNGANNYSFAKGVEIHRFKDVSVDNVKKTGLNGYVYYFSVDYDAIVVADILDLHKDDIV